VLQENRSDPFFLARRLLRLLTPFVNQEPSMTRLALPLCALAAFGLAGCTTYYDPPPAMPVTTTSGAPVVTAAPSASPSAAPSPAGANRSGFGIVESISLVTLPASATAGGTLPPVVSGPYRITMRMDDGNIQTMIVDNRAFLVGDRVQIMPDGRLIRP
jgi:hypothetical protein